MTESSTSSERSSEKLIALFIDFENLALGIKQAPGHAFKIQLVLERLLELERWGLPLEEPVLWPDRIARVTPRQVRQAARRHIHPAALARVEFGPIRPRGRRGEIDGA